MARGGAAGWFSWPVRQKVTWEKGVSDSSSRGQKKKPFRRTTSFPNVMDCPRGGQGPEGPTPATQGYSSTSVRVCQASVLKAKLAATVHGCWGLPGFPGGSFPGQREHRPPALCTCAPRPATDYRVEPKGEQKNGTSPQPATCTPEPPAGAAGRGGAGENPTG